MRAQKEVITPPALLRLATRALVRTERARGGPCPKAKRDFEGYRTLRGAEQRVSLAYTVVELALRVATERPSATATSTEIVAALAGLVSTLPPDLRAAVVELDLERIERALGLLEEWWAALAKDTSAAAATGDVARIGTALATLAESRFFHRDARRGGAPPLRARGPCHRRSVPRGGRSRRRRAQPHGRARSRVEPRAERASPRARRRRLGRAPRAPLEAPVRERLEALGARIERVALDPSDIDRQTFFRVARPFFVLVGWRAKVRCAALEALVRAMHGVERGGEAAAWRAQAALEAAVVELEGNVGMVERAAIVRKRPPAAHAAWLRRAWEVAVLASRALDGPRGGRARRRGDLRGGRGRPTLILPPLALESGGGRRSSCRRCRLARSPRPRPTRAS